MMLCSELNYDVANKLLFVISVKLELLHLIMKTILTLKNRDSVATGVS